MLPILFAFHTPSRVSAAADSIFADTDDEAQCLARTFFDMFVEAARLDFAARLTS